MIDPKIIRNYTSCLFNNIKLSDERKLILQQIELFNEVMKNSISMNFILCSPIISHFNKLKLIDSLAKKLKFEKITKQFIEVLIKNSRAKLLPFIVKEYKKLLSDSIGVKTVVVEAAHKLDKKEVDIIKKFLENKLDKIVKIQVVEKKSLIGGVVIKHDSVLYDYSIAGAIERTAKVAKAAQI